MVKSVETLSFHIIYNIHDDKIARNVFSLYRNLEKKIFEDIRANKWL